MLRQKSPTFDFMDAFKISFNLIYLGSFFSLSQLLGYQDRGTAARKGDKFTLARIHWVVNRLHLSTLI